MNNGKFLALTGGLQTEETAIDTSAGAADATKIAKLGATGRFHVSMMPEGTDVAATVITTSEALVAGDYVNIWNSAGVKVRKADGTVAGKEAHGFVLAGYAGAAAATVYFDGINTGRAGMTVGARQFLDDVAGASNEAPLTATGNVSQILGVAISATAAIFNPSDPILVA